MKEPIEFLRERLDEREQLIHMAGESRIAWLTYYDDQQHPYTTVANGHAGVWVADGKELDEPARVRTMFETTQELAQVRSKRAILDHVLVEDHGLDHCDRCMILRHLLAPYAAHPGYKKDWRAT